MATASRPIPCRQPSSFTVRNGNTTDGSPLSSSPPVANLKTTYPFFLPPGIALPRKGAGALQDFRDDFESTASQSASSRKSSSSSFSSRDRENDSPPSSLASSADDISRAKYCLEVEDPDLAAARRALWEDDPLPVASTSTSAGGVTVSVEEVATGQVGADDASGEEEEEEDDDNPNDAEPSEDSLVVDLPPVPSPSAPAHATLPPLPSCLRPRAPTRSPSASSSIHSAISVQFSVEPPVKAETYSPIDYKRGGEEPVEKLSIRDVVELMGVREAVGVWSGKIGKWQEGDECESPTSYHHGGGGTGQNSPKDSNSTSSTPTSAHPSHSNSLGPLGMANPVRFGNSVHIVGKPRVALEEHSLTL